MRRFVRSLFLCFMISLLLPEDPMGAIQASSSEEGLVVFSAKYDGNLEVYAVKPDGSEFVNLSNSPAKDDVPRCSPDGIHVGFESSRDGQADEIYVVNYDGKELTNVSNHPFVDNIADWSPDGKRIAFDSMRDSEPALYVVNANGTELTRVMYNQGSSSMYTWSPDGNRIAFMSQRAGNQEIFAIGVNGTELTRLTDTSSPEYSPRWSPNGAQIAFGTDRDGNPEIYVMNADGSDQRNVSNNPAGDWRHEWSPDGKRIVFVSNRDGDYEIYIVNADGSGLLRLTNNSARDTDPTWSPDGSRIAFVSDRSGDNKIYIVNADGSGELVGIEHTNSVVRFCWLPAPVGTTEPPSIDLLQRPIITHPPSTEGKAFGWDFDGSLRGSSPPNVLIHVYQRLADEPPTLDPSLGREIGTTTANREGNWMLLDIELEVGENVFVAVAELEGRTSPPSDPVSLYLPEAPAITFPDENIPSVAYTDRDMVGSGPPGALVCIYQRVAGEPTEPDKPHGERIGCETVDRGGIWMQTPIYLREGTNIFVAIAEMDGLFSEPSEPRIIGAPVSLVYGASYRWTLWDAGLTITIQNLDTRGEAEDTAQVLSKAGYDSKLYLNDSAQSMFDALPDAQVFYFTGHGSNRAISFEEESGTQSALWASSIRSMDLTFLYLAVLNACHTGQNTDASDSILQAFKDAGAETSIGFWDLLENSVARSWNESFWKYALEEDYSVADAAFQAARDIPWWRPGSFGEWNVVIVGDHDLHVNLDR